MFVIPDDFGKKPLNEAQDAGKASFEADDGFILKKLHEAAVKKCGKCKGQVDEFGVINTGVYGLDEPFSLKNSQYEVGVVVDLDILFDDKKLLGHSVGKKGPSVKDGQSGHEESEWDKTVKDIRDHNGALKVLKNYVAVFAGKDKANAVTADAIHVCRFETSDEIKSGVTDGVIAPAADFDSKDLWKLPGNFVVLKVPYSVGLDSK